jgi:glycosyltransferase involved in cell wall biosynthesis
MLQPSETFIRSQAEGLKRFRAIYLCSRRSSGLPLSESRVHSLCGSGPMSKLKRMRLQLFGPNFQQRAALAKHDAVLCHAHFAPDASQVLALVRALDIPLVVSLHGYDVTSPASDLPWLYLYRRLLLRSTAVRFLCVSEFIRNQALARGFPAEKTIVHYTGVDTAFFCSDAAIARLPIVLFVGRLVPGKGCEYLIRAMVHVGTVRPDAKLIVIGDGPQRRQLEREAATLLSAYEFLGVQPPAVVKEWMNRAKVFSSPCFVTSSSQEGFGMALAEAQAMGLPVVGSRIGGIPEAVLDGKTGFLTPERDPEALAKRLLTLLDDETLWLKFSKAGRDRVEKDFSLVAQTRALEEIYKRVLDEWASRSSRKVIRRTATPVHASLAPACEMSAVRRNSE